MLIPLKNKDEVLKHAHTHTTKKPTQFYLQVCLIVDFLNKITFKSTVKEAVLSTTSQGVGQWKTGELIHTSTISTDNEISTTISKPEVNYGNVDPWLKSASINIIKEAKIICYQGNDTKGTGNCKN